jgi:hypothetical protein
MEKKHRLNKIEFGTRPVDGVVLLSIASLLANGLRLNRRRL